MSGNTNVHEVTVPSALGPASIAELVASLGVPASADVVVLRGGRDGFCDGLDLAALRLRAEPELALAVHTFARGLLDLRRLPRPTLAVVEGSARGGGVGLLAACDVVIAAREATFSFPEGLFGLTPAIVGPFVAERIGEPTLRRLALTAASIDAREAQRLGLVDAVVGEDLPAATHKMIRMLSRTSLAAAALKRQGGPAAAAIEAGAEATLTALRDPAVAGRIRAFVEDGAAPWGRAG